MTMIKENIGIRLFVKEVSLDLQIRISLLSSFFLFVEVRSLFLSWSERNPSSDSVGCIHYTNPKEPFEQWDFSGYMVVILKLDSDTE